MASLIETQRSRGTEQTMHLFAKALGFFHWVGISHYLNPRFSTSK